jgi:tetratricopeptide (TPR) repeat protein
VCSVTSVADFERDSYILFSFDKKMRSKLLIGAGAIVCVLSVIFGLRAVPGRTSEPKTNSTLPTASNSGATRADRQIGTAQGYIQRSPNDALGYNVLADAYMQKARETGDFSLNAKAEAALTRSFEIAPDDYDAVKLKAKLLLTYHRFSEALDVARRAQSMKPGDHDVYGALTDALVELGDYEGAVRSAQTMVDLRPDTSSYSRVSYLRALHGDTPGAIDAMRAAAEASNPSPESMAWCRVQLGNELINAARLEEAEREFDRALHYFPDYHLALAAKARARLLAHDTDKAIEFYRRAEERVPLPDYSIALGDIYTRLGRTEEARREYGLVEFVEKTGAMDGTYSRQLALFWADHDMRLDDALAAARRERAARKDIYTCDALAWCLYKKGQLAEAQAAMDEAMRLGTLDPRLFYHAGMIAHALGDQRKAASYLKRALAVNPSFDILQADVARQTLAAIKA